MAKNCSFFAALTVFISSTSILCLSTDQSALLSFKSYITDDPHGILAKNWTSSTNTSVCTWIGVACDANQERVTALNMSTMSFKGTIAPHLANLTFLTSLDLSYNNFRGSIPEEFGMLQDLQHLILSNNSLSGGLPNSIFDIFTLQTLKLGYNFIDGQIPKEVGKLSNLMLLDLKLNKISGSLPAVMFNMRALRVIDVSYNSLFDILPVDMCSNYSKLEELYLSSNKLYGQIPASLYNCKELQYLSLVNNTFKGSLAKEIGNLTKLRHLYLGINDLQGEIPSEIGNLKSLEELRMESGSLTGPVPSSIFNISSLELIDLSNNKLSGSLSSDIRWNVPVLKLLNLEKNLLIGQIPSGLWECGGLRTLSLRENNFTGSISRHIGNLTLLKDLLLQYNNFTGTLPVEIGYLNLENLLVNSNSLTGEIPFQVFNISTMKIVSFQSNQFFGHLPSSFGLQLPNLEKLYLSDNEFSGFIPLSISNASKLTIIAMINNQFTGSIPNTLGSLRFLQRLHLGGNNLTRESSSTELRFFYSLTNCRDLQVLEISLNQFNGVLPAIVGNLSTSLRVFGAFDCKLKGNIPIGIGNLSRLDMVTLDSNELTGTIPSTLGRLKNMERVYLEHNKLNGSIPSELCLLKRMGDLYLSDNKLSGSIPACLGDLPFLTRLYLDSNKLTSTIPSTIWKRVDFLGLNFSTNFLSGYLPSEIGNLKVITEMDFSWNQFSGNIPPTIGGAQLLNSLVFAHNKLEGPIPQSLGSLKGLEFLDLSNNNLSGKIPKSLEGLPYLHYFNISCNELEGEIPTGGQFPNFTDQSYLQNDRICGAPRLKVQLCQPSTSNQSSSRTFAFLKYTLPSVAAAILLVALIFVIRRCRKQKIIFEKEDSLHYALRRFSYHELSRATDGFSESNLLGVGSVGSVYKGTLANGMVIAVKVFNLQFEGASKSFDAECEVMRNVRHRNLTKFISSCSNLDFKALILEWMPNGNLETWLYSEKYYLDFLQRLNIMIDVASALDYLHCHHSTPIIHCDLKPSNVLLDKDMIAHVSDFGIARLLGEEEFMAQTKTLGTIGYLAPEYGMEGIVSAGGDTYSYGILLMETFTRKRPTDEMFCGEMSLKDWVKEALHSSDVLDTKLIEEKDKHLCVKEQCASSIFDLAMECLRNSPVSRIDMEDVVTRLERIKNIFVEQCHNIDIA